jgi:NACHT domain
LKSYSFLPFQLIIMSRLTNDYNFLFQSISDNNCNNVKLFCYKYPHDKYVFSVNHESAIAVALRLERLEIYEFLISRGFKLGAHEKFDEIINEKKTNSENKSLMKKALRTIHNKFVKESTLKHLYDLNLKSKLSHNTDDANRLKFHEKIWKMYEELNELKLIDPILKVASSSKDLQIIFDFSRDSVDLMDPTKHKFVFGASYPSAAFIYIGAKSLLNYHERLKVGGTLAHELCHFTLKLVYKNKCQPFAESDEKSEQEYSKIIGTCEKDKKFDEIVSRVFDYPSQKWSAELIVRVPQLLVVHKENEEKLSDCQEKFFDLFNFYEKHVLVDLERFFFVTEVESQQNTDFEMTHNDSKNLKQPKNLIYSFSLIFVLLLICLITGLPNFTKNNENACTKAKLEIVNLNNKFQIFPELRERNYFYNQTSQKLNFTQNSLFLFDGISSNCVPMTKMFLFQTYYQEKQFDLHIFVELRDLENRSYLNNVLSLLQSCVKPKIIVICDDCNEYLFSVLKNISSLFDQSVSNRVKVAVDLKSESSSSLSKIEHDWNELTKEAQHKLMNRRIEFQGMKVPLGKILDNSQNEFLNEIWSPKDLKVGKEIDFQELEFYIERRFFIFNQVSRNKIEYSSDDVIAFVASKQIIIISDEPGMGKTTEFKMLEKKLKTIFPAKWIILMDLKLFVSSFDKDGKQSITFKKSEDISIFFVDKILKLQSALSRNLFKKLFSDDQVVFLMDGFDEISPSFKEFVMNLMKTISEKSNNQLWISTRPHLANDLTINLKTISFQLKPFSFDDQKRFFKKVLKKRHSDETLTKYLGEIDLFSKSLTKYSHQSVANPLFFQMIGEILEENENFDFSQSNFYLIYEEFVDKIIKKVYGKGFDAANDLMEFNKHLPGLYKIHEKKAFELIFEQNENFDRTFMFFNNTIEPPIEQIARIGLMYLGKNKKIQFVHRTFAEFFIANFIVMNIQKLTATKELDETVEFLSKILKYTNDYQMIKSFIRGSFKSKKLIAKIENREKISSKFENAVFGKNSYFFPFLENEKEPDPDTLKIISHFLFNQNQKLFDMWLRRSLNDNLLVFAAEVHSLNKFNDTFSTAKETFNLFQIRQLLQQKNEINENILHKAVLNKDYTLFDFIINQILIYFPFTEFDKMVMTKDSAGDNLLIKNLFKSNKPGLKFKMLQKVLNKEQSKFFLQLLEKDCNNTLLHQACLSFDADSLKSFLDFLKINLNFYELEQLYQKKNCDDETPLIIVSKNRQSDTFKALWFFVLKNFGKNIQKQSLLSVDVDGETAFHSAAWNQNKNQFLYVQSTYNSMLGKNMMKSLVLKKNSDGDNILLHVFFPLQNFEMIEIVRNCLKMLFEDAFNISLRKKNKYSQPLFSIVVNYVRFSYSASVEQFIYGKKKYPKVIKRTLQ